MPAYGTFNYVDHNFIFNGKPVLCAFNFLFGTIRSSWIDKNLKIEPARIWSAAVQSASFWNVPVSCRGKCKCKD